MPFVVDVAPQRGKQAAPLAVLRPAIEPIEYRLPWPELLGQISPRHAGSSPPKHSLDEVPIVAPWLTDSVIAVEESFDLRPLLVAQLPS
jgi:hypothetical protein